MSLFSGFVVAVPGAVLQWLIPPRFGIAAIPVGFFFSLALVALVTWLLVRFMAGPGVIGYYLGAFFFAPPAALGGIISGIIRARDRAKKSAQAHAV